MVAIVRIGRNQQEASMCRSALSTQYSVLGSHSRRGSFGLEKAAIGFGEAAGAEDLGEQGLGGFGQVAFQNRGDGVFDGIFDAFQLNSAVLDDRVGSPRVAVARLADAAGIDDQLVADFEDIRMMRMA